MTPRREIPRLGAELVHPAPLLALALLVANDHVLKHRFPGFITGKLSDFAGLFLFVVLVFVAFAALRPRANRVVIATIAALATAVGFSLVKLVPAVNRWVGTWWGEMSLDPTDLVALPMVGVALMHIVSRKQPPRAHGFIRFAAFTAAALACAATSPIRSQRAYPMWKIHSLGARRLGCAIVDVWISKSGKQGVGASIALRRAASGECRVRVVSAELDAGGSIAADKLPAELELDEFEKVAYVPFVFDNEASWNRGVRDGTLAITLDVSGVGPERLRLRMRHERPTPHSFPEPPPAAPLKLPPRSDAGLLMADPDAALAPEGSP